MGGETAFPLALRIVGRWRAEAMVLRAAAAYESTTPWGSVDQRWSSLGGSPEVQRFDHGTEDWPGWLVVS